MTRRPSMSITVRGALDERWPRVYAASRAHLASIEAFVLAGDAATTEQCDAALTAAHKLSGSLGMYGHREASAVSATIEELLSGGAAVDPLRTLVARLEELIRPQLPCH